MGSRKIWFLSVMPLVFFTAFQVVVLIGFHCLDGVGYLSFFPMIVSAYLILYLFLLSITELQSRKIKMTSKNAFNITASTGLCALSRQLYLPTIVGIVISLVVPLDGIKVFSVITLIVNLYFCYRLLKVPFIAKNMLESAIKIN